MSKSVRYIRSSPSIDEVRYWISRAWREKYSGVLQTWQNVRLMNPITTGSNNGWQNFNAKVIDIVFVGDDEIWIIETDPTPFQSSLGQLQVYKTWYEILIGRDVVQKIQPPTRRIKMNADIRAFHDSYADPEHMFYLPGIDTDKTIKLALMVRETDIMIEELCTRHDIRVIIIKE